VDEDEGGVIGECAQYICDPIPDKLDHHCVAPAALRTILRLDLDFINPQRSFPKKVAILNCLCSVSAVKVGTEIPYRFSVTAYRTARTQSRQGITNPS
jgi:hypothetical protein